MTCKSFLHEWDIHGLESVRNANVAQGTTYKVWRFALSDVKLFYINGGQMGLYCGRDISVVLRWAYTLR